MENQAATRKVLLIGDTTLDPLGRALERSIDAPRLEASVAPFGQVHQVLLDESHTAWSSKPDCVVIWTAPQLTLPSFARLLRFEANPTDAFKDTLEEARQFAVMVRDAAKRTGMVMVPTWVLPGHERWLQSLIWKPSVGPANLLGRCNLVLAEILSEQSNVVLLDTAGWQAGLQRSYDPRMYAVAKILYSPVLFARAASEVKAVLRGALGQGKKVIVCDLDNTMWGGVVGDDGIQNLKLGAPDPVGECFQAFQYVLRSLKSRGVLLAICSKNDEKFALQAIEEHPAMVLRKKDFVAWRINWQDKALNLVSLAEELNLGLDSFVFLDDSPQERDQVRQLLPQVLTPDLPISPSELGPFLSSMNCFETSNLGAEDFERTKMYQVERERKVMFEVSGDLDAWLSSLEIEVRAEPLKLQVLPRATQLLNKTNQFNLGLRRLDEKAFWDWSQAPNNSVYTFHVLDRFGDFGLTGLVSLTKEKHSAQIVDFVMSCRVMGKKVEEVLLGYTVQQARAAGVHEVIAPLTDGPRNGPAKDFFKTKYCGQEAVIDLTRVGVPDQIRLTKEN